MGYQGTRKEKILSKLYLQQYSFTSIQSLRKFTLGGVCKFVRIHLRIVFKAGAYYLMRILFPRSPNRAKGSSFPASKSARIASKAGALVNRIYSSGKPSTDTSTSNGSFPPFCTKVSDNEKSLPSGAHETQRITVVVP